MKIVQLIYSLSSGGGERFVVDLSNELAKRGHDVTLCMLLNATEHRLFNRQFLNGRVKFHSMGFSSGFSFLKVKRLESYILSQKPDVAHCHLNVIPYVFWLSYKHREIKFFHTLHSIASESCGPKYQYKINKYFYSKGIIRPVAISRLCQDSYRNFYKLDNAPYINNGRAIVKPTEELSNVYKDISSHKKDSLTPVFIHVARCNALKNQDLLIDTFNILDKENVNYILLVIGSGYDMEEGLKLKKKACNKILFLGEKNNVGDYLLCSDFFCLTSHYEGLPISLLESLSCGVTPVCTNVGGIPDVIIDKVTGYLSEDDIKSYVTTIKYAICHKIHKERLIKYFNDKFSIDVCCDRYIELYINK